MYRVGELVLKTAFRELISRTRRYSDTNLMTLFNVVCRHKSCDTCDDDVVGFSVQTKYSTMSSTTGTMASSRKGLMTANMLRAWVPGTACHWGQTQNLLCVFKIHRDPRNVVPTPIPSSYYCVAQGCTPLPWYSALNTD